MTMPASNVALIANVRNQFMRDSSGNASLNSQKYRDGAGKGTGSIALSDFANRAFGAGRTFVQTQGGTAASAVRPYHCDRRADNVQWDFTKYVNFAMGEVGGIPEWRAYANGFRDMPVAAYVSSFFYCHRPGVQHRLQFDVMRGSYRGTTSADVAVIGFSSGYLSGASTDYITTTNLNSGSSYTSKSFTFTPSASFPYVLISLRTWAQAWNGYMGMENEAWNYFKNIRVTV